MTREGAKTEAPGWNALSHGKTTQKIALYVKIGQVMSAGSSGKA
jgi:hypothetical protein